MRKMLSRLPFAALFLALATIATGCAFTSGVTTPSITSVSPNAVAAGSPGFTLTVSGTNFQSNSEVLWNGAARKTTYKSTHELQAAILSTDVAQAGTAHIAVLTPPFKTDISKPIPFDIPAPLQITTSSLPAAIAQEPYNASLSETGGLPPYTWSLVSGQLPTGLTLNSSTGQISGTTTTTGAFSFTVQVKDSTQDSQHASKGLHLGVGPKTNSLVITTTTLPGGTVQAAYSAALAASGGATPYSWSISSGALPPGLSLNASTGVISGTPSSSGAFSFTVQATDNSAKPQTASKQLSIAIAAVPPPPLSITTSSLPGGTVSASYSASLAASGGTPPYRWSVTAGALPGGLSLNSSTGAISGTPSSSGTFSFTVQAKDSSATPQTATKQLSIAITAALPPVSVTISPTSATVPSAGTRQFTATVSNASNTAVAWTTTAGSILSSGLFSAPTVTVNTSVTVKAISVADPTKSASASVTVTPPAPTPLSFTTTSLPSGTAGLSYSTTLVASGGTLPYSWSVTAGALPGGLSLNSSTGAISGKPSSSGTFSFTVQAKDSSATPQTASKQLSIAIAAAPPALTITTSSLSGGTVSKAYTATLAASGGTTPYTWSVTAGALPGGLSLNSSTGAISGAPSASGTFTFTVQAKDSSATPQTASKQLSIAIAAAPPPLTITTSSLPGGTVNVAYTATLAASGGTTPYTWSVSSGSLPNGLTLASSTGKISGTPTLAGSFSFGIKVSDSASHSTTATFSITIASPPPPPGSGVKTVFVVIFENTSYGSVIGNSAAPYINSLVPSGAVATQYFTPPGNHPSEPNYIWLEAGSNMGLTTDNDASSSNSTSTVDHLVTYLNNKGISWKGYMESMPSGVCPLSSSGQYAAKHDPFVFFQDTTNNENTSSAYCIAHVVPYTQFASDLSSGAIGRYNWITPNLCDDMHDCSVSTGDTWLSNNLPQILNSSAYKNNGAVFLIWDEGGGLSDGPLPFLLLSPLAKVNYQNSITYTHSSTLRTMQRIFNAGPCLRDACNATDLSDLFLAGTIPTTP